ncbi:MAG: HigA family addiction module antitoxin [Chitinivibrionia bacterium]|nr:HigA family addiction module antitoxin [Chitinivibrionia bacterium]
MSKYLELSTVGKIIREEFFEPYNLSVDDVAVATGIPNWELASIIYGGKDLTAEVSLQLAKYFGMSDGFFWGLQYNYYIRLAKRNLHGKLKTISSIVGNRAQRVAAV